MCKFCEGTQFEKIEVEDSSLQLCLTCKTMNTDDTELCCPECQQMDQLFIINKKTKCYKCWMHEPCAELD